MEFVGELSRDVQPEPGAIGFANAVILASIELIKDLVLITAANTNAGVFDSKSNFIVSLLGANGNASFIGILDGIRYKVL